MSRILIKGGFVIDPGRYNGLGDVLIENGKIAAVGKSVPNAKGNDTAVIDASGKHVFPGFIDLHVHFREPGYEYKETIESGAASAVAGGFTSVCCMPNTNPINDNQAVTEFILDRARAAGTARVFPVGAITKGSEGKELAEIGDLYKAGCVAISDDGRPVMNSNVMRRAMEYARAFDLPVVDHCEDLHLSEGGCLNEGQVSTELGLAGIPRAAEDVMVARNVALAELTGARLHLAHLSTVGSVRTVRDAKARGVKVTAEACPHHFTLTEEAARGYDTHAKMNPPLRTWEDVHAVKEGLRDGTIDAIATDHAPHAVQDKQQDFAAAPFGVVGLETALPLTLALVEEGVLPLEQAIEKLTSAPARAFGLPYGTLAVGAAADVAIVDLQRGWEVDPTKFKSRSRNTPFTGWKMKGQVVVTIVDGRVVFDAQA
ncbi:MAG TPA: dihydroorotase [Nitrospirales bacterium]|nr:dihydroorotase [Nitrospirales bacterium]